MGNSNITNLHNNWLINMANQICMLKHSRSIGNYIKEMYIFKADIEIMKEKYKKKNFIIPDDDDDFNLIHHNIVKRRINNCNSCELRLLYANNLDFIKR